MKGFYHIWAWRRVFPDSGLRVSDSLITVWDSQIIIMRVLQDSKRTLKNCEGNYTATCRAREARTRRRLIDGGSEKDSVCRRQPNELHKRAAISRHFYVFTRNTLRKIKMLPLVRFCRRDSYRIYIETVMFR